MALIYLTGMSGAGKTEIGKRLAQRLHLPFVDTDAEIQHLSGKKIVEIFSEAGEPQFRALESAVVAIASNLPEGVVALGAGALQTEANFKTVSSTGKLIYLQAGTDVLASRLFPERARRPLLANCATKDDLKRVLDGMLKEREKRYRKAKITVATADYQSIDSIADYLCQTLKQI